jgi:hypothetical protein
MAISTPDGFKAKVHMWMPVPVHGGGTASDDDIER